MTFPNENARAHKWTPEELLQLQEDVLEIGRLVNERGGLSPTRTRLVLFEQALSEVRNLAADGAIKHKQPVPRENDDSPAPES